MLRIVVITTILFLCGCKRQDSSAIAAGGNSIRDSNNINRPSTDVKVDAPDIKSEFKQSAYLFRWVNSALERAVRYTESFDDHVYYIYWDENGQSNGWRGQAIRSILIDLQSEFRSASGSHMTLRGHVTSVINRLKGNDVEKYNDLLWGYVKVLDGYYESFQKLENTLWSLERASHTIDKDIYEDLDISAVGEELKPVPGSLRESIKGLRDSSKEFYETMTGAKLEL